MTKKDVGTQPVMTNAQAEEAFNALTQLGEIGSEDEMICKRHAVMLRWTREAKKDYESAREVLLAGHYKKDRNGKPEVVTDRNGIKGPVIEHPAKFAEAITKLQNQKVTLEGMPLPFTWSDLYDKFKWKDKKVNAVLIEALGPLVKLQ